MMIEKKWESASPEQTLAIGQKIGQALQGASGLIFWTGDLGAGKTKLTQGIVSGLGIDADVTSPTFALINEYGPDAAAVHMDLYRLEDYEELQEIGFEDYLDDGRLILCEWPDLLEDEGFAPILRIDLRRDDAKGETARRITALCEDDSAAERIAAIENKNA